MSEALKSGLRTVELGGWSNQKTSMLLPAAIAAGARPILVLSGRGDAEAVPHAQFLTGSLQEAADLIVNRHNGFYDRRRLTAVAVERLMEANDLDARRRREADRFDDAAAVDDLASTPAEILGSSPRLRLAIKALGPVAGRRILDVACGTGASSVILASMGAHVVGCDVSSGSISAARTRAANAGLSDSCEFMASPLENIDAGKFDLLFGAFALHHLDLDLALPVLRQALREGGGFAFLETSARNRILMFGRRHLAGRGPIPKFGTQDEQPLNAAALGKIEGALGKASLLYPDFAFFQIAGLYLGGNGWATHIGRMADEVCDRLLPVRRWTYWVIICGAGVNEP